MYQTDPESATLMTAKEIVAFFRVSRTTFYRWLRDGKFPAPVFAPSQKTRFWRRSDVLDWSDARAMTLAKQPTAPDASKHE